MDKICDYENFLIEKTSRFFDFQDNFEFNGVFFNKKAEYNEKNSKYAISKEIKIYEIETNEVFLFIFGKIESKKSLINEIEAVKAKIADLAMPNSNHMSTQVLIIHVSEDEIPSDAENYARRFSYQKGFAFGFKGWADLGLAVISLENSRAVTHKKFRKTVSFITP